jgi:hypothetical protein
VEIAIQKKLQSLAKTTQTGSKLDEISKVFDSYLNPNLTRWNPKHPNANAYNGMAPIEGEELKQVIALRDAAKRLGKPDLGDSGSLYKIDLPDNQIAKMLDWDAPMTGQSDLYKQVAKEKELPYRGNTPKGGMDIYNSLVDQLGSPEAATKFLRDQGIPGIRYLDGGSRGAGQGSSNFVVFPGNENILQILERNGQPVNALRGLLER